MAVATKPVVGSPEIIEWDMSRDEEGHRNYNITYLVNTGALLAGPASALLASGLPQTGSIWSAFGASDFDTFAYCWPNATCRKFGPKNERGSLWTVKKLFSTKPIKRCQDTTINNPLDEPPRVSGNFSRFTKETTTDYEGKLIKSSTFELIEGIERDYDRPTIRVEVNLPDLGLDDFSNKINTVNQSPIWGLPARTLKLSNVQWSRNLFGSCTFYFTVSYDFEVSFSLSSFTKQGGGLDETVPDTWDRRDIVDAGYKVYNPKLGLPRSNPEAYNYYLDAKGNSGPQKTLLDGLGNALTDPDNPVYLDPVQIYPESNFFTLGIPSSLTA